jgi:hypothetical protein
MHPGHLFSALEHAVPEFVESRLGKKAKGQHRLKSAPDLIWRKATRFVGS